MTDSVKFEVPRTGNPRVDRVFEELGERLRIKFVEVVEDRDVLLDAKQALDDALTEISALTPLMGVVPWHDGTEWKQTTSPNGLGDKVLNWNDTTKTVEWN